MAQKKHLTVIMAVWALVFTAAALVSQLRDDYLPAQVIPEMLTQRDEQAGPTARLLAFGDLMLSRDVAWQMEKHGEDYPFEKIFGEGAINVDDYDLVTANLEGPIVEGPNRPDLLPIFAFDPVVSPRILKKWGFDLLNLANNHTWDYQLPGWESTLSALESVDIATVGHPLNNFEHDLYETEVNGIKLGFIGITDVGVAVDWAIAKQKVAELKARNDFVILMIHWGSEYYTTANKHQKTKAHGMADAGVDLIIGHHPHVVQGSEYWNNTPIYYSLGNFVFDQYWGSHVKNGLGLDISISKQTGIKIREIPFTIEMGQPRLKEN